MAKERINNGPVLTTFTARILSQFRQTVDRLESTCLRNNSPNGKLVLKAIRDESCLYLETFEMEFRVNETFIVSSSRSVCLIINQLPLESSHSPIVTFKS